MGLFWLAVAIWVLTTFPCIHLRSIYANYSLAGAAAHREFFAAYVQKAIWTTAAAGLVGPALLWAVPKRLKSEANAVFLWAGALGLTLTSAMWFVLAPAFRLLSEQPLDLGNFLYSGLVAGIVVGEVHRRALLAKSGVVRSAPELKRDFYVAALMVWAVLLKVLECIYLTTAQPGRPAFGVHFFMFLSVLVWTPWVCKLYWKREPDSLISSVMRSCAAGVLGPPLSGLALLVPALILLYSGFRATYAVLWGLAFFSLAGNLGPVLFFVPGLTWGTITGLLRWRYLQIEKQIPLPSPSTLNS